MRSNENTEHKFELEEETFINSVDLANIEFTAIERALATRKIYPKKPDEVEEWHEMHHMEWEQ